LYSAVERILAHSKLFACWFASWMTRLRPMMENRPRKKRELVLSTLSTLPLGEIRPNLPLKSPASHLHIHTHTHTYTPTHIHTRIHTHTRTHAQKKISSQKITCFKYTFSLILTYMTESVPPTSVPSHSNSFLPPLPLPSSSLSHFYPTGMVRELKPE